MYRLSRDLRIVRCLWVADPCFTMQSPPSLYRRQGGITRRPHTTRDVNNVSCYNIINFRWVCNHARFCQQGVMDSRRYSPHLYVIDRCTAASWPYICIPPVIPHGVRQPRDPPKHVARYWVSAPSRTSITYTTQTFTEPRVVRERCVIIYYFRGHGEPKETSQCSYDQTLSALGYFVGEL